MKTFLLSVAAVLWFAVAAPKTVLAAVPPASTQQQSAPKTKIYSGTILKNGDGYVLSDAANKLSFILDDTEKASHYEGKKVKVTGTVDVASNTIHVETIQEIA